MNLSSSHEITSDARLLTSLGLAVAEARITRSLIKTRETSLPPGRNRDQLDHLTHLDREIDYLEAKLIEIKSKMNRAPG